MSEPKEKSYLDNDCIEIDEALNIEQETFLNILMGLEAKIPDPDLIDYYVLFERLEMKERQYLIVKEVEKLNKIPSLLALWKKASERYEKEKKPEPESGFSMGVLNALKDKEEDVRKEELDEAGKELLKFLEGYKIAKVEDHKDFAEIKEFPKTHEEIVKKNLKNLYSSKKYSNVTLKTDDGGDFKVHREILIWKSNFFHRMIKFGGAEAEQMKNSGEITLAFLTKNELEALLQFMYTGAVETKNFEVVFKLLNHAEMYCEIPLKNYLLEHVRKISKELKEKNNLEAELEKYGKFLENEQIINEVADWLFTIIEREKLLKLIEKSKK